MLLAASVVAFVACSGGVAPKAEPPPAPPPKVEAPPPAPVVEAAPASGPYTPDDLAKAAYAKATAAGADALTNAKAGDTAAIAAGKASYDIRCATCHGATGKGDGIAGTALPQKPANFSWKERWDATSIGARHWIVMNGVQGTAMAPLGLTDDQAWEVLAYIQADLAPR